MMENFVPSYIKQLFTSARDFEDIPIESEQDQINYLTRWWFADVKNRNENEVSENQVKVFVEKLFEAAPKDLSNEDESVLDKRAQYILFHTCFFPKLEQHLKDNNATPNFDETKFELLHLYDQFYNAKCAVFFKEEADPEKTIEASLDALVRLSVFYLMKNMEDAEVLCQVSHASYLETNEADGDSESMYSDDLKLAMKLGFVRGSPNERPPSEARKTNFKHRTFAEYFFASFIVRNLIQEESELFDKGTISFREWRNTHNIVGSQANRETLDKSVSQIVCQIMNETILVAPEYAGVRIFLDRMLAQYVPPAGERSAFAAESREDVLKKWPAIGHKTFNRHLAEQLMLQETLSERFARWPREQLDVVNSQRLPLYQDIWEFQRRESKPQVGLDGILHGYGDNLPSITAFLINCIKEYACRPDTSDSDREKLAYSFSIISFVWRSTKDIPSNETRTKLITSMIHFFDRVPGIPSEANDIFSKWFFKFLFILIGDPYGNEIRLETTALTCERLALHSDAPFFADNVNAAASLLMFDIIVTPIQTFIKSEQFMDLQFKSFVYLETSGKQLERVLNSLSDSNVIDTASFTLMANRFVDYLSKPIKQIEREARASPSETNKPEETKEIARTKPIAHPFAFGEIVEFFAKTASKLLETDTKLPGSGTERLETGNIIEVFLEEARQYIRKAHEMPLANNSTEGFLKELLQYVRPAHELLAAIHSIEKLRKEVSQYIQTVQEHLIAFNSLADSDILKLFREIKELERRGGSSHTRNLLMQFTTIEKIPAVSVVLWYYLQTDKITGLPDLSDHGRRAVLNLFFNETGRKCLIAFAHADCCCQCKSKDHTGLGIHFPYEMYQPEETRAQFSGWFADKLKLVWQEKGEIEFINFLFKGVANVENAPQVERQNEGDTVIDVEAQLMDTYLQDAERAKLPCLLFSDLVSEYIPEKLSSNGLKHLVDTLQATPLLSCRNGCFTYTDGTAKELPETITNSKKSLWDGVMQEDAREFFGCKSTRDQKINALRERFNRILPKAGQSAQ